MRDQRCFDEIARDMTRASPGVSFLILDRALLIRAASEAYERVTLREHGELPGQYLFDAFPDNPDDPRASGASNLAASLETAMRSGRAHNMRLQRYDIPNPAEPGRFLPKVWSPSNSPVLDHGELVGVVHCVEEVSESERVLAEVARDLEQGGSWTSAELLHTFAAINVVERTRHSDRQRALITEAEQLRRALGSRDTIGQAKGMLMERFDIDSTAAFQLLVRLSQGTNTRVAELARMVVEVDHPGSG